VRRPRSRRWCGTSPPLPVDRSRVYVAGSRRRRDAADPSILLWRHLAACAIVAGVMYRAADSALGASQAMRAGARLSPEPRRTRLYAGFPASLASCGMVMHGIAIPWCTRAR